MEWKVRKEDALLVCKIEKELNISRPMAQIMVSLGLDYEQARKLLNDPTDLFEISNKIYGMEEAAKTILANTSKRCRIFADYDVDGLMSGFILYRYLSRRFENIDIYFPKREDGYGLNIKWCAEEVKEDPKNLLVITVDNGITAIEETKLLKENGATVVIIDHHEPSAVLPDADAICDAWVDGKYGTHLCAAAVVWKVVIEMELLKAKNPIVINKTMREFLPSVAIATISDVMPSNNENRAIIQEGLKLINAGKDKTMNVLMKEENIEKMRSRDVAWTIAPELNACSRMQEVELARKFIFGEDNSENYLSNVAKDIKLLNKKRKNLTQKAIEDILAGHDYSNDIVCFADATDYPIGLMGILAGKLSEMTGKPAIVYRHSQEEEDLASGSARAPEGYNIKDIINYETEQGNAMGAMGHAQACGCCIIPSRIDEFNESLKNYVPTISMDDVIDIDDDMDFEDRLYLALTEGTDQETPMHPKEDVLDAIITPDDMDYDTRMEINSFGYTSDDIPKIGILNTEVEAIPWETSGGKRHVLFRMRDSKNRSKYAVYWNGLGEYEDMGKPKYVNLCGSLDNGAFCRYFRGANLTEHSTILVVDKMDVA